MGEVFDEVLEVVGVTRPLLTREHVLRRRVLHAQQEVELGRTRASGHIVVVLAHVAQARLHLLLHVRGHDELVVFDLGKVCTLIELDLVLNIFGCTARDGGTRGTVVEFRGLLRTEERLGNVKLVSNIVQRRGVSLHGRVVVRLLRVQQHLDELVDAVAVGALGERLHGRLDQIESLLQIVEANDL